MLLTFYDPFEDLKVGIEDELLPDLNEVIGYISKETIMDRLLEQMEDQFITNREI